MSLLSGWLAEENIALASAADRAVLAWRRINDRPTTIEIGRGSGSNKTTLAGQVVRIEGDNTVSDVTSPGSNAIVAIQKLTVFGVKDHPDPDVEDTDIRRGDRFVIDNVEYQVMTLNTPPGEVQAIAERRS